MFHSLGVESAVVVVMSNCDATVFMSVGQLVGVAGSLEIHLSRGGHINIAGPKTDRNGSGDVFIQMKLNRRHALPYPLEASHGVS